MKTKRSLTPSASQISWTANSFRPVVVGSADRAEFAEVLRSVRVYPECRAFADLHDFERWTQTDRPQPVIDVLILLQSYTGEHPQSVFERIRQNYPITPVVSVLGSWCEGEQRTGWPLAATNRIYGNDWIMQGESELYALEKGEFSLWGLPPTFRDDEILLEQTKRRTDQNDYSEKTAWIFSCRSINLPDAEMNRLLAKKLQLRGIQASFIEWNGCIDFSSPPTLILWDIGVVNEKSFEQIVQVLRELRQKAPQSEIVLRMNAPRTDETRTLCDSGADQVLSKFL